MIDNYYLFLCTILSFSGFTIAFYGTMARQQIDRETKKGLDNGVEWGTDSGAEYFAKRYENWEVGAYFESPLAPFFGLVIVILGSGLNLIHNLWYSSILLLVLAYFLYFLFTAILKWRTQLFSILVLVIASVLIIIELI